MSADPLAPAVGAEEVRSLGSRTLRASVWTALGYGGGQILRLAGNLILARLLFPEAFGLMALVNVFLYGMRMFSDFGFHTSIIQNRQGDDPAFYNTAWTLQVMRGVLLWGMATAIAWPVAAFYEQPTITQLLPAGAVAVLVDGFVSTSLYRLQRHLEMARYVAIDLGAHFTAIVVMLVWVLVDPSVWALVAGTVTISLTRVLLSHLALGRPRNRVAWDSDAARELLNFGKWLFLSSILTFLVTQADRLIFGKLVDVALLGVYNIAAMLGALPTELLLWIGASAVFPAFSRVIEERGEFRPEYRRMRRPLFGLGGLIVVCMAASGPSLIAILYDSRYAEAGWILQLLAVGAWFQILGIPVASALLALGQPRWMANASTGKLVGIAALVPLGYWLGGFAGAVLGFAASDTLRFAVLSTGAWRQRLGGHGEDLLLTLCAAACAGAGLFAAAALADEGSLLRLAGAVGASTLAWLPVAAVLMRSERGRVREWLGRLRGDTR